MTAIDPAAESAVLSFSSGLKSSAALAARLVSGDKSRSVPRGVGERRRGAIADDVVEEEGRRSTFNVQRPKGEARGA